MVVLRDIDARVGVESSARRHTTYARGFGAPIHGQIAPAAQLALHFDKVILRAFERGFDRVLLRMVGAQTRTQELVHALQVRFNDRRFAAGDAPSDAPSGGEVVLGKSAESNDRDVGCDRGHGHVRVVIGFPINNQLVINLIGKDDQIVLARQFRNLLEHLACAD